MLFSPPSLFANINHHNNLQATLNYMIEGCILLVHFIKVDIFIQFIPHIVAL